MGKNLLNNPIVAGLVKSYMPSIIDGLGEAETALIDYLNSFTLKPGETEINMFTQVNNGKLYICTGAFTGATFSRQIKVTPAREFIKELLLKPNQK